MLSSPSNTQSTSLVAVGCHLCTKNQQQELDKSTWKASERIDGQRGFELHHGSLPHLGGWLCLHSWWSLQTDMRRYGSHPPRMCFSAQKGSWISVADTYTILPLTTGNYFQNATFLQDSSPVTVETTENPNNLPSLKIPEVELDRPL